MKTSELSSPALDWAVAKCEGATYHGPAWTKFSTDWAQGGPIIEREGVFCKPTINKGWRSYQRDPFSNGICNSQYGPTPLIAAMRCYVASKLGDTVHIPEELA